MLTLFQQDYLIILIKPHKAWYHFGKLNNLFDDVCQCFSCGYPYGFLGL